MINNFFNENKVPNNKLGIISSPLKFSFAEIELPLNRLKEIQKNPKDFLGDFSIEHLKKLHEYIFQDIYDINNPNHIVGKLRSIELNGFSNLEHIIKQQETITKLVNSDNRLSIGNPESYKAIIEIAHKSWANHAFNDGNTRVTEAVILLLGEQVGLKLNLDILNNGEFRNDLESALQYKKLNDENGIPNNNEYAYCILYENTFKALGNDYVKITIPTNQIFTPTQALELLEKQENKEFFEHPKLLKLLQKIEEIKPTFEPPAQ